MADFNDLEITPITLEVATQLVRREHYSGVMPKLTRACIGGFLERELVAVITFGYGVRPVHTLNRIFPNLSIKNYLEIGKMCVSDIMPRNSESFFVTRAIKIIKNTYPELRFIYTWADGIRGKPGYVYQSMNFLYGGYIWTDIYMSEDGERIHPRGSKSIINASGFDLDRTRPNKAQLQKFNISHVFGKQFRYVLPIGTKKQNADLLSSSPIQWGRNYPKSEDLLWKIKVGGETLTTNTCPIFSHGINRFSKEMTRTKETQMLLI